jgi:hypothetical protein
MAPRAAVSITDLSPVARSRRDSARADVRKTCCSPRSKKRQQLGRWLRTSGAAVPVVKNCNTELTDMFGFRKVSCSARNQVQGNKQTTSRGAVGRDLFLGLKEGEQGEGEPGGGRGERGSGGEGRCVMLRIAPCQIHQTE